MCDDPFPWERHENGLPCRKEPLDGSGTPGAGRGLRRPLLRGQPLPRVGGHLCSLSPKLRLWVGAFRLEPGGRPALRGGAGSLLGGKGASWALKGHCNEDGRGGGIPVRGYLDTLDGNKAALLPSTARTLPPAPDDSALGGLWLQAEASSPASRLPEKVKPPRPGEQPTPASEGGAWQLGGPTHTLPTQVGPPDLCHCALQQPWGWWHPVPIQLMSREDTTRPVAQLGVSRTPALLPAGQGGPGLSCRPCGPASGAGAPSPSSSIPAPPPGDQVRRAQRLG